MRNLTILGSNRTSDKALVHRELAFYRDMFSEIEGEVLKKLNIGLPYDSAIQYILRRTGPRDGLILLICLYIETLITIAKR